MADVGHIVAGVVSGILAAPATLAVIRWAERSQKRNDAGHARRADDCQEELAKVRERLDDQSTEITTLRVSVVKCEGKHAASEAQRKADAETHERELGTLRGMLSLAFDRLTRLERDTDPPPGMEPAE